MSYESAMEAAGAKILAYESFGDYQGTWLAKVEYNGEVGWTEGSYGSCSGCDAFESEIGYSYDEEPDYEVRLAEFGRSYLEVLTPQEYQEKYCLHQIGEDGCDWYLEEYQRMLEFVRNNK